MVIFPNFFEKADVDFRAPQGFSCLAVFIWLHLNVNRVHSGILSLEYLESKTEFYTVCVLFCFNLSSHHITWSLFVLQL